MPIVTSEKHAARIPAKMRCESCGAEFSCGANTGECWCFTIELKPETLTDLREKFNACLCENCLNQTKSPRSLK